MEPREAPPVELPNIDGVPGDGTRTGVPAAGPPGARTGVPAADPHKLALAPMGLSSSEMRLTAGLNGAGIGLNGAEICFGDGDATRAPCAIM